MCLACVILPTVDVLCPYLARHPTVGRSSDVVELCGCMVVLSVDVFFINLIAGHEGLWASSQPQSSHFCLRAKSIPCETTSASSVDCLVVHTVCCRLKVHSVSFSVLLSQKKPIFTSLCRSCDNNTHTFELFMEPGHTC
jgi:hypothetical protein